MVRPRERVFITGNRWEAVISPNRKATDITDLKLKKKGVVQLMSLEDVREMRELMENLEGMMEEGLIAPSGP